jgi:hypothetical protein
MKEGVLSGDELVRRLATAGADQSQTATDLLEAFGAGYPIGQLIPLLKSDDEAVAFWASYVLSELGEHGYELLSTTRELLGHKLEDVRIDAINSLLSCSRHADGPTAAAIVSRYSIETRKVRASIIDYLARAPLSLLQAAPDHIVDLRIKQGHLAGVALFSNASAGSHDELASAIMGSDEILRAYGLAVSIRLHLLAASLWKKAARTLDPVISEEARVWLDSVLPP